MRKIIFITLSSILLFGCYSQKKAAEQRKAAMDSWIGSTKQQLIMSEGIPLKTASDGSNGEILMYGKQFTFTYPRTRVVWAYKLFYLNSSNKIYHWLIQESEVPPQQIDINLFVR